MPGSESAAGAAVENTKKATMAVQQRTGIFMGFVGVDQTGHKAFEMAVAACLPMRMQSGMPMPV